MTGTALLFVLALALSVGGGLVLYALVRREHDDRERMDRAEAERAARRDTDGREW
jgi:hypothetical protein